MRARLWVRQIQPAPIRPFSRLLPRVNQRYSSPRDGKRPRLGPLGKRQRAPVAVTGALFSPPTPINCLRKYFGSDSPLSRADPVVSHPKPSAGRRTKFQKRHAPLKPQLAASRYLSCGQLGIRTRHLRECEWGVKLVPMLEESEEISRNDRTRPEAAEKNNSNTLARIEQVIPQSKPLQTTAYKQTDMIMTPNGHLPNEAGCRV
jgi:hypothetical protein